MLDGTQRPDGILSPLSPAAKAQGFPASLPLWGQEKGWEEVSHIALEWNADVQEF